METPGWHINAIDLVYAGGQPTEQRTAATLSEWTHRSVWTNMIVSDYLVLRLSQFMKIGMKIGIIFPKCIQTAGVIRKGGEARVLCERFVRVLY